MSFEGYYQFLCKIGHYHTENALEDLPEDFSCEELIHGAKCEAEIADKTINLVDDTNVDSYGYRKQIVVEERQLKECNLGHKHEVHSAKYQLSKEQYFYDGNEFVEIS